MSKRPDAHTYFQEVKKRYEEFGGLMLEDWVFAIGYRGESIFRTEKDLENIFTEMNIKGKISPLGLFQDAPLSRDEKLILLGMSMGIKVAQSVGSGEAEQWMLQQHGGKVPPHKEVDPDEYMKRRTK